jgi:hypothetical protein
LQDFSEAAETKRYSSVVSILHALATYGIELGGAGDRYVASISIVRGSPAD